MEGLTAKLMFHGEFYPLLYHHSEQLIFVKKNKKKDHLLLPEFYLSHILLNLDLELHSMYRI